MKAWGSLEAKGIQPKHVLKLRDAWASTPATANNNDPVPVLNAGWSVPRGWMPTNPCGDVKPVKGSTPYEPWPWEVIHDAKEVLPDYLWWAVALALYTGQRLGDCLAMQWTAIQNNTVSVTQEKTGKSLVIRCIGTSKRCSQQFPVAVSTSSPRRQGGPGPAFKRHGASGSQSRSRTAIWCFTGCENPQSSRFLKRAAPR